MTGREQAGVPRISGLGAYRPSRVVSNDELALTLSTSDEWIRRRTGIATRRIAAAGETVVAMGAAAASKAVADAGVDPAEVDLVILTTCTMPSSVPGGAAAIAAGIGAGRAGAYDVNAACAGFCYGLSQAADAVRAGSARTIVVVASELMSAIVDWTDRSSAILFGDGAGAAVVTADGGERHLIGPVVYGADGNLADLIDMPAGGKLQLDGPAVFRWATTALGPVVADIAAKAGVSPDEIDAFVPHQANGRIIDALARELGLTNAVVAHDVEASANTSSASIPLAIDRLRETGQVNSGDLALLIGFGAGVTWAGQVVSIP